MNKTVLMGLLALAAVGLSGCATVEYSAPDALSTATIKGATGPTAEHVVVDTYGYYLLWYVPLVSGDLRWDEEQGAIKGGTRFFRDMVGVDELQTTLLKIAESRNCNLAEVTYNDTDSSFAGLSYSGAAGALFGSSHMSVSAVLVHKTEKED